MHKYFESSTYNRGSLKVLAYCCIGPTLAFLSIVPINMEEYLPPGWPGSIPGASAVEWLALGSPGAQYQSLSDSTGL